jgi:hypothetical protein
LYENQLPEFPTEIKKIKTVHPIPKRISNDEEYKPKEKEINKPKIVKSEYYIKQQQLDKNFFDFSEIRTEKEVSMLDESSGPLETTLEITSSEIEPVVPFEEPNLERMELYLENPTPMPLVNKPNENRIKKRSDNLMKKIFDKQIPKKSKEEINHSRYLYLIISIMMGIMILFFAFQMRTVNSNVDEKTIQVTLRFFNQEFEQIY